jgi:MFS family permease
MHRGELYLLRLARMHLAAPPIGREQPLLPLLAWGTAALFFFYAWVLRVAPSVMVEELMREFAAGAGLLGHLSGAYYYAYAGMQIPVGLLLDRFGPRRLITAAALTCAGGCVLFATGESLAAVTAGRLLIGASSAFSLVGAMAVAGQWFPAQRFALFSGLAMAMGMAGGVLGQAPLRLAIEASDWRTVTLFLASGGAMLAAATWLTVRDRWQGTGGLATAFKGLGAVLRNRQTLLIAGTGLGTSAPLLTFAGLWGVPFLETAYGMSRTSAAGLTSIFFIGWGVGAPLVGWLSDRIGRRRAPLLLALFVKTLALAGLIYVPGLPTFALAALSFLVGFFGSAQIICFALVKENNAAALSGTAIGFLNCVVTGAGALFQPLVGVLLDFAWTGEAALGARTYSAEAYRLALASLIACCVSGLLCLLAVRETYCRPRV